MSERPEEGREERRRTGPLGDEDETRQVPTEKPNPRPTRPVHHGEGIEKDPPRRTKRPASSGPPDTPTPSGTRSRTRGATSRPPRSARTGSGTCTGAWTGWRASSGSFSPSCSRAVFSAIAGLVLVPFGFSPELSGGQLGASVLTGLGVLGVLIFLTYFFGGYVAGRLARFDGGRNGAMVLVWTFIVALILALVAVVFSGFLPAGSGRRHRQPGAGDGVDGGQPRQRRRGRHRRRGGRLAARAPRRLSRGTPRQQVPRRDRPGELRDPVCGPLQGPGAAPA